VYGHSLDVCRQIEPIYSGAGYRADIQKGLDAGAQAYLVKPDFDRLKETIDRLIDQPAFNHGYLSKASSD
jgi:CheY-like chemotaxis protein